MPLARVLAYDATNDNALRFAWILMDFVDGNTYSDTWLTLSMEKKEKLVLQLANYQAKLFTSSYPQIGSVYASHDITAHTQFIPLDNNQLLIPLQGILLSLAATALFATTLYPLLLLVVIILIVNSAIPKTSSYYLGPTITRDFYHITPEIRQGPFSTTHDWLLARMQTVFAKYKILMAVDPETDPHELEEMIAFGNRIINLLPHHFPPRVDERFYLHTQDIHEKNILMDGNGDLLSMLDWGTIAVVPAWMFCTLPSLLTTGLDIWDRPDPANYSSWIHTKSEEDGGGEVEMFPSTYWEDLRCHEMTLLKEVYLAEMERLQPAWIQCYRSKESVLANEFSDVIGMLEAGLFWTSTPHDWLEKLERGEDVTDVLYPPRKAVAEDSDDEASVEGSDEDR
jgi:hypothetical protein